VMRIYKENGEGRKSQLIFILSYCITLMRNMFRLKYKKPSTGLIRVLNERLHFNCTDSVFVTIYVVEVSTSQFS
jgi:hypothetical protein